MDPENIKKIGKCCITDKPLSTSKEIIMIQLPFKAKWEYPSWGNVVSGESGNAVAYAHHEAIYSNHLLGPVLYAVEFKGDEIIYHDVKTLDPA